ncbi:hypothetical protein HYW76_02500 [Candidatus Pacearchaeota archaeon]|nr:hypothetical protein [Candidatus Pacearchaeota archaeon]
MNSNSNNNERAREFLECLGNGKTIYECESENDLIDAKLFRRKRDGNRKK